MKLLFLFKPLHYFFFCAVKFSKSFVLIASPGYRLRYHLNLCGGVWSIESPLQIVTSRPLRGILLCFVRKLLGLLTLFDIF